MTPLRALGVVLAVVGLVLSLAPTLIHDPGPAADIFAAVERRIPWGGVCGLGLALLFYAQGRPLPKRAAVAAVWLIVGVLIARTIGITLDGWHPRQAMWWVAEAALGAAAWWYARR
jgi:hypothetical protein